ncbi:MAG: T9SS type A sorting domain-containing protein [Melioribacteraceae bacterium]|nr:T9SS type A sorting domain-containing protein [Melioribacteraceae bacterium]
MKIIAYILFVLINTLSNSLAQQMPLVYDVENTGAESPIPYIASFSQLTYIQALPNPFMWSDNRGIISNYSDWRHRRAEIGAEIQRYEIGEKPTRPDSITASYSAGVLTVNITLNGNTLTLTSAVALPAGSGPFPAVIGIGSSTGSLPSDIFTSRDIARITFNFGQVMAHQQVRGSEPINLLYPELTYIGAYSAWSWGISRLIDGLELVQEDLPIDLRHLGVTGCSFAGKMALFAGAFDERIALTVSQESGGGGYTTWRFSETLGVVETLSRTDHTWFIEDLFQFSNAVPKLPYDHHELMAMVAPRALFVLGNPDQVWLADESGHVGSKATKEVYKALGIPDRFGFSIVGGHAHCQLPNSQKPEVEAFVEKFLLGNENVNTEISTSIYNTNLSPWINWATPELSNGTSFMGKTSLIYPANLQKDLDTNITLIWNKVEDADKYFIQLAFDPTFKNIEVSDSTTDTVKTFSNLLKGKKYYCRIQGQDIAYSLGPWSNPSSFSTFIALPAQPQLIGASPYPNRPEYISFNWEKARDATQYFIEIANDNNFSNILMSATTSDTVKVFPGFSEGQNIYWRVYSKNVGGNSDWSVVSKYTLIFAPTDLILQRTELNEITLTWNDNSEVEDGYVIEHKLTDQAIFSVLDTLKGSGNEYVDKNVEQEQTYNYRIKAYKELGESEYSNEASLFLVGVVENDIPNQYSIGQNYPNPFNPTTKIKFGLPNSTLTKLIIYDLLGKEIQTLINKELETGYHEINFDASNYQSGIYFYRIQAGNYIQTKKMVLIK